jgi:hypothetical protein
MSWEALRSRLVRDWQPGQHVTLVGPTGSGKTHLALMLLELCRYRLVLATKRQDPLVGQLRADGFQITGDLKEIQWTLGEGGIKEPLQKRVVFWPTFPEKMSTKQRLAAQAALMARAIDWADKTGGWAVLVDETILMHDNLRLERELSAMWYQGRTQGLSVIACAQRPSRVPRLAWTQADYFFIWSTQDKTDLDSLRDISAGIPKELIEDAVKSLDWDRHEALFVSVRDRELARVVAPPR